MDVAVHYAEIGLKGRNRPQFEDRLVRNLRSALADLGEIRGRRLFGRLLLTLPRDASFELASERMSRVFGVANFGRATRCEPTVEAIETAVDAFVAGHSFESFGVRARRVDKQHPFRSRDLERRLGTRVQKATGARVDLGDPDVWIEVHVLSREALLLHERVPGPGGIPVGASGHVVSLISGGIDSPVATHHLMRRGCEVSFVHFHSHPFTSAASQQKVRDVVALLARWQPAPVRLWLVPFGELQRELVRDAPPDPRIVLYRRFMLRVAEALAGRVEARALVTGESLAQVSSQTLGNLDTINRVATLPVLRPLVGLDKVEIVRQAEAIETFSISIEPDEDCCSYLMPRRPATSTRPDEIDAIERRIDVKGLVDATLERVHEERIEPIR